MSPSYHIYSQEAKSGMVFVSIPLFGRIPALGGLFLLGITQDEFYYHTHGCGKEILVEYMIHILGYVIEDRGVRSESDYRLALGSHLPNISNRIRSELPYIAFLSFEKREESVHYPDNSSFYFIHEQKSGTPVIDAPEFRNPGLREAQMHLLENRIVVFYDYGLHMFVNDYAWNFGR